MACLEFGFQENLNLLVLRMGSRSKNGARDEKARLVKEEVERVCGKEYKRNAREREREDGERWLKPQKNGKRSLHRLRSYMDRNAR